MKSRLWPSYPVFILLLLLGSWFAFAASAAENVLTLDGYLGQVAGENRAIRAAQETSEGAGLRSSESTLIYSPVLFAEARWVNDHEVLALFRAYDKLRTDSYSLGINQLTPYGTKFKVAYTLENYDYVSQRPRFWEGLARVEVSQSLLRNGFGAETRAQAVAVEAAALGTQYQESFRAKALRAEAESAYIRLASAREVRRINEDSLKRAQEILGWQNRRYRLNLGENSDLLQSQANIEVTKLQLQSALDSERTAARDLNRMRNLDSDTVSESVVLPSIDQVTPPNRGQFRDDVRAAIEGTRAAAASAEIGRQRNKPELEVYGSYALNSRQAERSTAISRSFSNDFPTSVVGVRFSTPLLIGSQLDAVKGYGKEAVAAETLKDQKIFEQEVTWKDLVLKLEEAKRRYAISVQLAAVQKKKAESERSRLRQGRTTTYQSLIFDQDLNIAEATRIQAQAEVLQILSQMKTF